MPSYPKFDVGCDYDVYCYLKANLPSGFEIAAAPATSYYSEWQFDYTVTRGDQVIARFAGDYRKIQTGSLVQKAREVLARVRRMTTEQAGDEC